MKKQLWYLIGLLALIISLIFDKQIITFITNNRIASLNSLFILLELINGYIIFIIILIILLIKKEKKLILPLLISFLAFAITVSLLKELIARPRPFIELASVTSLIVKSGYSFPSGHITAAFTALPFLNKFKKIKIIAVIIAIILMFSRLYLGVHYLSDVIAAAIIGYFIADFTIKHKNRYSNKIRLE